MSDSSTATRQIQLEAIRQSISEGKLTAQQIHNILLEEIAAELNKPQEEVDIAYVNACQDFLTELNRNRAAATPSHYEENLIAVQRKFQPRFSFSPRTALGRFAVVMCIAILIVTSSLILPEGWIITRQSEDEGQYIMQGIETPDGFRSVAEAGPATGRSGMYVTSEWAEAVQYMGGIPPVPQWLPSGWSIQQYTIGLMSNVSSLTITYVHPHKNTVMTYTYYIFFDYNLNMAVEQDEEGVCETLDTGTEIYIATNMGHHTAVWYTDQVEYMVTGEITHEQLLHIVESVR